MAKFRNVRLPLLSLENSMNTGFLDTNLTRTLSQWLLWGLCKHLHQDSRNHWNYYFFGTDLSTHLALVHRLRTCLRFFILLSLVVVYQIQPSNVVELQQHSPLFNNTSITIYVHWMIISQTCLFKHMKSNEHVAMLFQYLLDHTQQKLYFCLILLLRNNVLKNVYINLRHSVCT